MSDFWLRAFTRFVFSKLVSIIRRHCLFSTGEIQVLESIWNINVFILYQCPTRTIWALKYRTAEHPNFNKTHTDRPTLLFGNVLLDQLLSFHCSVNCYCWSTLFSLEWMLMEVNWASQKHAQQCALVIHLPQVPRCVSVVNDNDFSRHSP